MKQLTFVVLSLLLPFSAMAQGTGCSIYVVSKHPFCVGAGASQAVKVNTLFADSDPEAILNAGRCMERALEYAKWCGDGNKIKTEAAVAYFMVNGKPVIHSYAVTATERTYFGNGLNRALKLNY